MFAAGGDTPVAVPLGEDLQEKDGVSAAPQEGVGLERDTKELPNVPGRVGGGGATRNDSGFDGVADKAKVSAEFITGFR